ncbi:3-oxo-tetronate kinase [Mycolicibacterium sp.]|uniref:3-oxo-tetronate kinase n=1 Tax=Mycolicibacterium sp. TaxID=2320850 RepID=UPI0037C9779F
MQLGCVADDFTGATDLAGMFARHGLPTLVVRGVPSDLPATGAEVVVVALKSRTAPADAAVRESVAALKWLREQGCQRFYFKYCSTFDSTPQGNIGPVMDALMSELDTAFTVACPALPVNGRTVYNGHLFVGTDLLHESSMRNHPLTPMDDANLVRLLNRQTSGPVGLISWKTVASGTEAIRDAFAEQRGAGVRVAVVDAIADQDLVALGEACAELPLVTAASGLATGLLTTLRLDFGAPPSVPRVGGACAVVAGSASKTTAAQIGAMRAHHPAFEISAEAVLSGSDVVSEALDWAAPRLAKGPVLVHTVAGRVNVKASEKLELTMAAIACGLVSAGVRRLVVAGGETSGAVVNELGVRTLHIGPEISPGVPWTFTLDGPQPIALALKSGNFGSVDLFTRAFEVLP